MFKIIKEKLGFIKRGLVGFLQNHLEGYVSIPKGVEKFALGVSGEGREIFYYKIGNGPTVILFVSAIHGNEVGTSKMSTYLINWLNDNKTTWPRFTFFVIPILNPYGYTLAKRCPDYLHGGRLGRFNSNNVDLNRNFPTPSFKNYSYWSTGKNYANKTEVFCGPSPASEPEIKSLTDFILKKKLKFYIAFHSAGADVMGNSPQAQNLAQIFSQASGYKISNQEDWKKLEQTGTAKEWCDMQNITYLEIESRYRWGMDWHSHKKGLEAVLNNI